MNIDWIREYCLSLPHATETLQWGESLVFKIAGKKMFAVLNLEAGPERRLAFKCTPEKFYELTEIPGIVPSPYLAKSHWVAIKDMNALRSSELQNLMTISYDLVFAKLPKRTQTELAANRAHTSEKLKASIRKSTLRKTPRRKSLK
ncbi:MAG TPA: MmcQ/YjbR family DNA-binding protein [Terriglobales bacterium]|nr:MmcQ/YjbR family DNA-binding protein [Terriglobales bacterium]